jgi:hypothetical protein
VDLIKICCKHICKYHNASPLYNYYILIKIFFKGHYAEKILSAKTLRRNMLGVTEEQ